MDGAECSEPPDSATPPTPPTSIVNPHFQDPLPTTPIVCVPVRASELSSWVEAIDCFCYQRDEMVACELAPKTNPEPQDQGKASVPPRMFDLDALLS